MAEEHLDWPNLDAIWISHLHLDHCAGLTPFLFGIKWAEGIKARKKPLRIFGCEGVEKLLKAIDEVHHYRLFEQPFAIEIHEIPPHNEPTHLGLFADVTIETISTPHRRESLAVRLMDANGATLVYSSDTGYSETLADFARKTDLLILECSFYRNKATPKHLELADAMRIAQHAEPGRLLLTHLFAEWDEVDLETEAGKSWPGTTIAAYDGLRIDIPSANAR